MMYYKIINDRMVFSDCKTIQTEDGSWISNPTSEQIAEAGWLEYIPPVVPPEPQSEPDYDQVLQAVKRMLASSTESLSDEDALAVAAVFETWNEALAERKEIPVGKRLWYDGRLWKVITAHVPQEDWTPDTAVSLFTEVSIEEWPEWRQPVGSEDAYKLGDQVSHNEKHWRSDYDNNVWEPGVYGWTEK